MRGFCMRHMLVMAAAVLVGLAACTGKDGAKEKVSVRFETGIESGRLGTKGVADVLAETAPSGSVELRLVGEGADMTVRTGESVELVTGRYRVTGRYETAGFSVFVGFGHGEPVYVVDSEVEVRSDRDSYVVPVEYACWALVLDSEDTAEYRGDGVSIGGFEGSGRYQVVYVTEGAPSWTLTVVPVDAALYAETEFEMGGQEDGKWYCYHAGHGVTSGAMGVELPEWEEGE